ncbi:hypothetical protein [Cohaesibacter sp. ES.047]|uniref:hypothetical protein n=1 Tax=Cohaesibacter sp. ES.047 TaxID=1798205 RepID=UPI0012FD97E6|nr:hypothetical protein [Cohaesibacter sp. ES.047]
MNQIRYEVSAAFQWSPDYIDGLDWSRIYGHWIDAREILLEREKALRKSEQS